MCKFEYEDDDILPGAQQQNEDHWALIDHILEIKIRSKQYGVNRLQNLLEAIDRAALDLRKKELK